MKFLKDNLLEHLQRPEFSQLRSKFSSRHLPKSAFICQPGAEENLVFIVAAGKVRVYLGYEDKEFNLGILTQGDLYSTHTGTFVQAMSDIEILVTDVATFRQSMMGHPEVAVSMVRVLGDILKTSFDIIDGLAFKDANCRLVSLLMNEAQKRGIVMKDGSVCVEIGLSVEQIARLVGASRQTVSTLLNDLIRANLLKRAERGCFIIPDPSALSAIGGVLLS